MSARDPASVLATGELTVVGRLVSASNATFYARAALDGAEVGCVYKPVSGERPLWDFPDRTLARREVATYAVARAAGWDVVPTTLLREGPFGPGMCQLWVDEPEPDQAGDAPVPWVDVVPRAAMPRGWLRVLEAADGAGAPVWLVHADDSRLRRMAVLDVVVNNADRKGGHILTGPDGVLRGVDHGLTFHLEPKLRTVLWGWAGCALDDAELAALGALEAGLRGPLGVTLGGLLAPAEMDALAGRVARLRARGQLPSPGGRWPSIPWPAF